MSKEEVKPGAEGAPQGPMAAAYLRFLHAIQRRPTWGTPSSDATIEREVWEAGYAALRLCARSYSASQPLVLPPEIAHFFADIVGDILAGRDPETLKKLRSTHEGAPARGDVEQQQILTAVGYILACRRKLIDDRSPNRTVSNLFGVAPSTVRGWCRGVDASELPLDIPIPQGKTFVGFLRELLDLAGREYRAASHNRAHSGVARRDAKRQPDK